MKNIYMSKITINQDHLKKGQLSSKSLYLDDFTTTFSLDISNSESLNFVNGVTTIDCPFDNRLLFVECYSDTLVLQLNALKNNSCLSIVSTEYFQKLKGAHILAKNPREIYAKIVSYLFDYENNYWRQDSRIHETARIEGSAQISNGVTIGYNSTIGQRTIVLPNVTIGPNCHIGRDCIIKSGTIIGQPGFGIFLDNDHNPQHLPHVGGVIIRDRVEIGALNTIAAGTIHPTRLHDDVKTDDHVHIAHNCSIGERTLIAACSEISGSVQIGSDCWLGPNSSIVDRIKIGDQCFVGIASNVTKTIEKGSRVGGNPARLLKN
jgi:UDP-3-O-[3-hydroxymyristoyl] glucosamine N-acyltransferase LpxD